MNVRDFPGNCGMVTFVNLGTLPRYLRIDLRNYLGKAGEYRRFGVMATTNNKQLGLHKTLLDFGFSKVRTFKSRTGNQIIVWFRKPTFK